MYRLLFICLMVSWLAVHGGTALAQPQLPDLTVTLHDVAGAPLAGVVVLVRDASGSQTLAQAVTDANGAASFTHLMESQVRVAVLGALPNGTTLYQPGDDAVGIRLLLNALPATLTLRSAADGMVAPDPAEMAREIGVPIATSAAAVSTAPAAPTLSAVPRDVSPSTGAVAPSTASAQVWAALAGLILLIGVGVGIVVAQRRSA